MSRDTMDEDIRRERMLSLLPGLAQGLTSVSLGHPLDTAKTRMQAMGPLGSRSATTTMWNMTKHEGLRSLYRGVTPPLVMVGTKRSLQFALWDIFRGERSVQRRAAAVAAAGSAGSSSTTSFEDMQRSVRHMALKVASGIGSNPFLSGSVAGGLGTLIGCPMHVTKIRTQYATRGETLNALTCAISIARTDGFFGFYRGFRFQFVKDICFAGLYLGLYDVNKTYLRTRFPDQTGAASVEETRANSSGAAGSSQGNDDAAVGNANRERRPRGVWFDGLYGLSTTKLAFIAGSLASMTTWVVLYPLDTIKTIAQARNVGWSGIVLLIRQEHFMMLYRGLPAALVKAGPVSGLAMVAYESVKARTEKISAAHRANAQMV